MTSPIYVPRKNHKKNPLHSTKGTVKEFWGIKKPSTKTNVKHLSAKSKSESFRQWFGNKERKPTPIYKRPKNRSRKSKSTLARYGY